MGCEGKSCNWKGIRSVDIFKHLLAISSRNCPPAFVIIPRGRIDQTIIEVNPVRSLCIRIGCRPPRQHGLTGPEVFLVIVQDVPFGRGEAWYQVSVGENKTVVVAYT